MYSYPDQYSVSPFFPYHCMNTEIPTAENERADKVGAHCYAEALRRPNAF